MSCRDNLCTCCLLTTVIGAIVGGMMIRIMTDPGT